MYRSMLSALENGADRKYLIAMENFALKKTLGVTNYVRLQLALFFKL